MTSKPTPPTSASVARPIEPTLHPIETGSYRIPTPAIQAFSDLVQRCLRYRITGALTYGPSRIGKTRAIEYLRLLLAQTQPKLTTYHAQAEHKPGTPRDRSSPACWRPSAIRSQTVARTPPSACA